MRLEDSDAPPTGMLAIRQTGKSALRNRLLDNGTGGGAYGLRRQSGAATALSPNSARLMIPTAFPKRCRAARRPYSRSPSRDHGQCKCVCRANGPGERAALVGRDSRRAFPDRHFLAVLGSRGRSPHHPLAKQPTAKRAARLARFFQRNPFWTLPPFPPIHRIFMTFHFCKFVTPKIKIAPDQIICPENGRAGATRPATMGNPAPLRSMHYA